jgi:uncharacterized protein YjcR
MTYKNAAQKRHSSRPIDAHEWLAIESMYEAGHTDLTIAQTIGCSSKTIARWRWRNGLPRNDRREVRS